MKAQGILRNLDPKALRQAFGSYMTGVTVVTALAPDGTPMGFTANSFTSVSLDPPLLLVCPGKHLSSFGVFRDCTRFAVSVLAEGQEDISNIFAKSKGARFGAVNWTADAHGVPTINQAAACFSCATHRSLEAGDHTILIGLVTEFSAAEAPGLGYGQGGYFSLAKERMAQTGPTADRSTRVGVIIEHEGALIVQEQEDGYRLPTITLPANTGGRTAIKAHLAKCGLDATIGQVYSVFDVGKRGEKFIFFTARLDGHSVGPSTHLLPISQVPRAIWSSPAVNAMMARYYQESANNQFGLYIGDAEVGDVHQDSQT
tara:strand:- start:3845 stop:4789 length:945 start_codon:yes stop_codon:yes gene_type:complete